MGAQLLGQGRVEEYLFSAATVPVFKRAQLNTVLEVNHHEPGGLWQGSGCSQCVGGRTIPDLMGKSWTLQDVPCPVVEGWSWWVQAASPQRLPAELGPAALPRVGDLQWVPEAPGLCPCLRCFGWMPTKTECVTQG